MGFLTAVISIYIYKKEEKYAILCSLAIAKWFFGKPGHHLIIVHLLFPFQYQLKRHFSNLIFNFGSNISFNLRQNSAEKQKQKNKRTLKNTHTRDQQLHQSNTSHTYCQSVVTLYPDQMGGHMLPL